MSLPSGLTSRFIQVPSSVFSVKVLVAPLYFSMSHFFSDKCVCDDIEGVEESIEGLVEESVEGPVCEIKV